MNYLTVVLALFIGVSYADDNCNLESTLTSSAFGKLAAPLLKPGLNICKQKEDEKKCLDANKLFILLSLRTLIPKGGNPDCSVLLKDYKADNLRNEVCNTALNDEAKSCNDMKGIFCKFISGKAGVSGLTDLKNFMVKKAAVDKATEICKQGVSEQDTKTATALLGGAGANPLG